MVGSSGVTLGARLVAFTRLVSGLVLTGMVLLPTRSRTHVGVVVLRWDSGVGVVV